LDFGLEEALTIDEGDAVINRLADERAAAITRRR
jgi:hypothetical protein